MKLLDRLLLWIMSVLTVALGLLLMVLALFPSAAWMQVPAVRVTVAVLALVNILCAVGLHLRRAVRKRAGSALVSDGENGSAYVNLSVVSDMAKKIAQDTEGVRSCRSTVKNNGGAVDVELELGLHSGTAVAPLAALLQEQLKTRIFEMTGIRVGKVSMVVEAAAEGKAPKQASAEHLPGRVK